MADAAPAPTARPARAFLGHLHAFRGVAILSIMGAHAWSGLGYASGLQQRDPGYIWLYATTEALFHGTTLFFALISGVLYARVLRGMPWRKFFVGKLKHVVLPYIVVSTALTALYWPEIVAWTQAQKLPPVDFPTVWARNLVRGEADLQFWYIPVLVAMFALTPLLEQLLRWRRGGGLMLLAALPLVVSRTPYPELLSLQTLVYFLGAYALGMVLGDRLDDTMQAVRAHRPALWAVFGATLAANWLLFFWAYVPGAVFSAQQFVVYLNKLSAALLLLQGLHALGERIPALLHTLGTYAFTLYFVHLAIMWTLGSQLIARVPGLTTPQAAVAGVVLYGVATVGSLGLGIGLRRLLGRHSRLVIGA